MKNMLSLAVITALGLLSGCGDSDNSNNNKENETPTITTIIKKNIEVERGKIYDANVTDSSTPPQEAQSEVGSNIYTFENPPLYPIKAHGGWIDVDSDGKMTSSDVSNDTDLTSYSDVITPTTTYLGDTTTQEGQERLEKLVAEMNVTKEDLLSVPSKAHKNAILVANAIYTTMKTQENSNISFNDLNSSFSILQSSMENLDVDANASEIAKAVEIHVMDELVQQGKVQELDTNAIEQFNTLHNLKMGHKDNNSTNDQSTKRLKLDDTKGIAYDSVTKLMWQNKSLAHTSGQDAIDFCANLELAGYEDWVLPTKEQSKIFHAEMNKQGTTPTQIFSGCTAEYVADGYVKTQKGSLTYGGEAGDSINFSGGANVRCIRESNDEENKNNTVTTSSCEGSEDEKMVCEHNALRAKKFTGHQLTIDTTLKTLSETWAEHLVANAAFKHDPDNGTNMTGENLYVTGSSDEPSYKDAIVAWNSEEADYDYDTNTCTEGKACGHYTQLVWKDTSKVGCAKAQYTNHETWGNGWVVVCKYQTPGNYVDQKPY